MEAKTHKRTPRKRTIRMAKVGNARAACGPITPGCEIYCLTFGQFSLIDALIYILEEIGPADVDISTWTAAAAHLDKSAELMNTDLVRNLRFVVDRSFLTRQPAYCRKMVDLFGNDAIRTCRSHAKFMALRNERFNIAVRTSMNLNENPRLENIEISDDADLCGFLTSIVDSVYDENVPGPCNENSLPLLEAMESIEANDGISARGRMDLTQYRSI